MASKSLKWSGELITTPLGSDKATREGTQQCVHCGRTWVHRPGSGKVRGFCFRCNGHVCGPDCEKKCVPQEQVLENIEKGRPLDYRPIVGFVPALPKSIGGLK